jgi:hypothetical protein
MNFKPLKLILFLLGFLGILLFTGCDSVTVGASFQHYDPSTGMSYGIGVSDGPYGRHGTVNMGYSSGGYYGRPYR